MKYRLFIWDLDNTLIGSSDLLWGAFGFIAEKYTGQTMTPAEIVSLFGPPEGKVIEQMVGIESLDQALGDFYEYYRKNHAREVRVFTPVFESIRRLRERGVYQALFTSKARKSADITLQSIASEDLFDAVVCGDEVERPKPFPDGVWKILETLQVPARDTVYLGDSPLDRESAESAGVSFAYVLWDSFHRDTVMVQNDSLFFQTPKELDNWIDRQYSD